MPANAKQPQPTPSKVMKVDLDVGKDSGKNPTGLISGNHNTDDMTARSRLRMSAFDSSIRTVS